ncbi:DUF4336 domain-containing protein [Chitinivorax sp. B]|uniref:DUF4336 domain-containing protein n=1 Tax=Chitinivorax sp. B TaxID=2502235 RepID=UPI0010FA0E1E|nr:DUF4336 domain-containing protein [Chitinivorax sp. B]
MSCLLPIVDGQLWHQPYPIHFAGLTIWSRMTVVRLSSGGLFVHSPAPLTPTLQQAIDALGPVSCIVAPNLGHHLNAGVWANAYPAAALWIAPGLASKRPDLLHGKVLSDSSIGSWQSDLAHCFFEGLPMLNETAFFHHASRTLILTDLCVHFGEVSGWIKRLLVRGVLGHQLVVSPTIRVMIKDKVAARRSRDQLLDWPIERVIVAHEQIVPVGGRQAVSVALAWLG